MDNSLNNEPSLEKSNSAALWLKRTAVLILWLAAFLSGVTALYGLTRAGSEPANLILVALLSAGAWYGIYFGGRLTGWFRSSENPQIRYPAIHWAIWTLETFFALFFASIIFDKQNIGLVVFCLIFSGLAGVSAYLRGKRLIADYRLRKNTEVRATVWRLIWSFIFALLWSATILLCLYALLRQMALPEGIEPATFCFIFILTVLSGCAAYYCWNGLAKLFQKYAQQQKTW